MLGQIIDSHNVFFAHFLVKQSTVVRLPLHAETSPQEFGLALLGDRRLDLNLFELSSEHFQSFLLQCRIEFIVFRMIQDDPGAQLTLCVAQAGRDPLTLVIELFETAKFCPFVLRKFFQLYLLPLIREHARPDLQLTLISVRIDQRQSLRPVKHILLRDFLHSFGCNHLPIRVGPPLRVLVPTLQRLLVGLVDAVEIDAL